jgi:hypothetical protein
VQTKWSQPSTILKFDVCRRNFDILCFLTHDTASMFFLDQSQVADPFTSSEDTTEESEEVQRVSDTHSHFFDLFLTPPLLILSSTLIHSYSSIKYPPRRDGGGPPLHIQISVYLRISILSNPIKSY